MEQIKSKKINSNGSIDLDNLSHEVKSKQKDFIPEAKIISKYKNYCIKQMKIWNESIANNKFKFKSV